MPHDVFEEDAADNGGGGGGGGSVEITSPDGTISVGGSTSAPQLDVSDLVVKTTADGLTIITISQSDYDALGTPDPNTLYLISG